MKREEYVTGQHYREVHLAEFEALKLPSSDAGLFEILLCDFGTIPKNKVNNNNNEMRIRIIRIIIQL